MAISITAAEVKRKAGIDTSDTTYDSAIAALISEMQGPVEYSIADVYLNDTANTKLQATLKLGMLEIISGEFIEQIRREIGATEQFGIAGVTIGPSGVSGKEMGRQGAARLATFLKSALPMDFETHCSSTTTTADTVFALDREV